MTTNSGTTTTKSSFWSKIPKPSIKTILISVLVLLLTISAYQCHRNIVNAKEQKIISAENLAKALNDTIHFYKDKYGNLIAEKLTLQTTISALQDSTKILTLNQKELVYKIKTSENNTNIISAALIKSQLKIDSLMNITSGTYDSKDNTISFEDSVRDMQFDITVTNARPFNLNLKTGINFNYLNFPNTQFITFQWDNNKSLNYPISFTITNSNKYMAVTNIDSYAIPTLQKKQLNPTFWNKLGTWFKTNGHIAEGIVGGFIVGWLIHTK